MKNKFHESILRAYDIRGVVGETLTSKDAFNLGFKFSCFARIKNKAPRVVVGYDGRLSSNLLNTKLIEGLLEAGSKVTSIGLCSSPMLYYASKVMNSDGAIMITGSHNPANYNGFKMLIRGKSLYGRDIQKLAVQVETKLNEKGTLCSYNIEDSYLSEITKDTKNINNTLKVVWDAGNGSTGNILKKMIKLLPGKHILLNTEVDGTFPSHHPDPTEEKNLKQLKQKVFSCKADIGIAFDGDGDRIGVINNKKSFITGDKLLFIFASEVVKENPGAIVISDVKASNVVFSEIKKLGGTPLMWKTGHSFIKEKMRQTGALLAGEMSGHVFFADKYFGFDDAMYASIRLLKILSKKKVISNLLRPFSKLISTPEIKIYCNDEAKFNIIKKCIKVIKKKYSSVNIIDGMRVTTSKGWWLLRASNTQPALIVRCEAENRKNLDILLLEVKNLLERCGVNTNL
ncbi:MAG: Phosphomannomutase/phosphoglucomutase [Alphaproteobacteria bacterium MarineAlpha9_Bin4]|nr:phosphomannomutase [Pelagibacterales bacterium]PPR26678.1 MAG: Phosphomannomutase/phosphoglucomutase [Alphaproteobacteria bacterium MarineAlpha9_Bin4]|tara:strand:+ start:129 stop:1499 length:1371 start_codon:yes stop_codon:yes gene_type:complete